MGAGGMYPNYPYSNHPMEPPRPYYNYNIYPSSGGIPPPGYSPNIRMYYGRSFPRPYTPMNYTSTVARFPPGTFHQHFGNGSFINQPYAAFGGVQSAPPSTTVDGNIHIHHSREYRSHFDEQ